jgi:pyruvate formate lyase activating enzyme
LGICAQRKNIYDTICSLSYGKLVAAASDPIEKKPLYHFLPGTLSYSIASPGCNMRCSFCQNWTISQPDKKRGSYPVNTVNPEVLVRSALSNGCASIAYTYTEPVPGLEYFLDYANLSRKAGLKNIFITNGYFSEESLIAASGLLDAANIDIKSFSDGFYRKLCGASLPPVLRSVEELFARGVWIEITTLLIPGENDSDTELNGIASFISGLDRSIPWHISRYRPAYKFTESPPTPPEDLERAKDIGAAHGLEYVYIGNIMTDNNTYCPGCGALVLEREYMSLKSSSLEEKKCPDCGYEIRGVWE